VVFTIDAHASAWPRSTFFTVQSGDFTVRDADRRQLPAADRPQGSLKVPFGL
jgi:hypothetical protein